LEIHKENNKKSNWEIKTSLIKFLDPKPNVMKDIQGIILEIDKGYKAHCRYIKDIKLIRDT
jgi:hypothetical protein